MLKRAIQNRMRSSKKCAPGDESHSTNEIDQVNSNESTEVLDGK